MGNNLIEKEKAYMHVKLIGTNMEKFYANLNKSNYLKNIKLYWDVDPLNYEDNLSQINKYFDKIQQLKKNKDFKANNLKECLILRVRNLLSSEVKIVIEKMDSLVETYFMPLVLLLTTEETEKKISIDEEEFTSIDPRLIFIKEFSEDEEIFEEKIAPILVRFCSIHNDLGDKFYLEKEKEDFDLSEHGFSFNINIACIGAFGQGKSTGVNFILDEYKAKESNKGSAQTKCLVEYFVRNKPIRIIDIPGFDGDKTVKDAVEKFQQCRKGAQLLTGIHIILYFIDYSVKRIFGELEFPIIEELSKNESSKIIYVITRSKKNIKLKQKNSIFQKINSGIQEVLKNKNLKDKFDFFKADENNVVFVNLRKDDEYSEPFGKKELFNKIKEFFKASKTYKESLEDLNEEKLKQNIETMKNAARSKLLPNKIFGAIAGIFPFIDLAIQKFFIKKSAIRKAGECFNLSVEFADEKKEEETKKLKEKKNQENCDINLPDISEDKTKTIKGNEYEKDSTSTNITKVVDNAVKLGTLTQEVTNYSKILEYSSKVAYYNEKVNELKKGYLVVDEASSLLSFHYFTKDALKLKYGLYVENATHFDNLRRGITIFSTFGKGSILSIGLGFYCTHSFCEDLIKKLADCYEKNASKRNLCYEEAISYFDI